MTPLIQLQVAASLADLASLLGFQPKALSYVVYIQTDSQKYSTFEIPKKSGGTRKIDAPSAKLKNLQSRVAKLLTQCVREIEAPKRIRVPLSHGFKRGLSILSNAKVHKNRRFVFNIDLENFFGEINFGRVRGFFIKNRDFSLNSNIATILAKIACHNGALPQGSPCSPVISNLIANILDVRLAEFAKRHACKYSRYADDLTFSTNSETFPEQIAKKGQFDWVAAPALRRIIKQAGFSLNPKKTRLQPDRIRQTVTGLVVNKKANVKIEDRRITRALVHKFRTTGAFQMPPSANGGAPVAGTPAQLAGLLSFQFFIGEYSQRDKDDANHSKKAAERMKALWSKHGDGSFHRTYRDFLLFKDFYFPTLPTVVCEGKTDNIYLRCALRKLANDFPKLIEKGVSEEKPGSLLFRLYRYTKATSYALGLSGGTGGLQHLITHYRTHLERVPFKGPAKPVIILLDNDKGANTIRNVVTDSFKKQMKGASYVHLTHNLYVMQTPLSTSGTESKIEDFFEKSVLDWKLGGKTFTTEDGFDQATFYGKKLFAEHVVRKNSDKINFDGFKPILVTISEIIEKHK